VRVANCQGAGCTDADGDGLVDAWEESALERMRPFVTFDEGEPMIANKQDVLASIGRVAPFGQNHVVVNIVLLYTRDYGAQNPICFSASEHPGDVEHVAIDLEITGKGTAIVRTLFTTGHEGTEDDQSRRWKGADFRTLKFPTDPATSEPRWQVFASRSKHATYATKQQCESASFKSFLHDFCLDETCAPDDVSHPSVSRASRRSRTPERPRIISSTISRTIGFAGEHVWGDQRSAAA